MPERTMTHIARQSNAPASTKPAISKGLGASLLCLSMLVGCASTTEREQPSESVDVTPSDAPQVQAAEPEAAKPAATQGQATQQQTTQDQIEQNEASTIEGATVTAEDTIQPEPSAETPAETSAEAGVNPESDAETASVEPPSTEPEAQITTAATANQAEVSPATADEGVTTDAESPLPDSTQPANTVAAEALTGSNTHDAGNLQDANSENPADQPVVRSSNNLGKSYGIWTLRSADNGFCKLKTPTLQISNTEYSSQIWMDIEEQQVIVNAYMPLNINHPKTGIQIDNQALLPFAEKVNSTRAIVKGDITSQLSAGKELHIFINGKEVGKQVLQRNVKLTNMNTAISALKSCSH
ncbi:hypothetical protein [Alkalimarinus coralli]|uniref:hypothetical protein n=1 Tax=Alkalimarinus coralli TaxID=2935863 RepID=UPI00202B6AC2|nr:hypothetical protein [Alkalimarinus coralli]